MTRTPPFSASWHKPRGVAVAPSGRIFVIDMSGSVIRFSPTGECEHRWEMPKHDTGTPSGLFVDCRERVFVADTHNSRVMVFDADGRELLRFGRKGLGAGEFVYPNDVIVDHEGFIYVSEYGGNDRISKFTPELQFIQSFGGPEQGADVLAVPYGMALDGDGMIWVADTGNHRICQFDRGGNLVQTIGGLGRTQGSLRYPYDVAWVCTGLGAGALKGGRLLVCEKGNSRIHAFTPDGEYCATWGRPGRGEDELDNPMGLAVTATQIVIADTGNDRLTIVPLSTMFERAGPPESDGG